MNNYFERCCKRVSKSIVSLKKSRNIGIQKHVYHAVINSPDSNLDDILAISSTFVKIGQDSGGSYHVYFNGVEVPLTNEEKENLYERARIQYNVTERKNEEKILEKL